MATQTSWRPREHAKGCPSCLMMCQPLPPPPSVFSSHISSSSLSPSSNPKSERRGRSSRGRQVGSDGHPPNYYLRHRLQLASWGGRPCPALLHTPHKHRSMLPPPPAPTLEALKDAVLFFSNYVKENQIRIKLTWAAGGLCPLVHNAAIMESVCPRLPPLPACLPFFNPLHFHAICQCWA